MGSSIFTHLPNEYKRNLNIVDAYISQIGYFLHRSTGKEYDYCRDYVKRNMQADGKFPLKNPRVLMLQRAKNGDRNQREDTFLGYIDFIIQKQLIVVPTFTVYLNPNQRKSLLAEYITNNLKLRKTHKKLMFDALMIGDEATEVLHDNIQSSLKIKNNSLSGAHSSPSTPLYNKSSHSTLTSTCRISTSYANANNEMFLAGNRHYWSFQTVINHLIVSGLYTDYEALKKAIEKFNLHIPTVDEVMDCINYSSDLYWQSEYLNNQIRSFVNNMTDSERASFVYTGDLFHLAKYNPEVVKNFLGKLPVMANYSIPIADAKKVIKGAIGDLVTTATLVCSKITNGRILMGDKDSMEVLDPEGLGVVAATILEMDKVLTEHKDLIVGLWRPSTLTQSIAVIPNIIRRAVVTSDTDSTIFTNQYWTNWMSPDNKFSEVAYNTGYATTFLVSQTVRHKLAMMSANLGFIEEHIHQISMKNEFYFPVFSLTSQAKHYFANRSAKEGNVLPHLETEIKGVNLRDSNAPAFVTKMLKKYMETVMHAVMDKGEMTIEDILSPVAELELDIINDIKSGGFKYMKGMQIKDASSYTQKEEAANFQHYITWNIVFAPTYGEAPEPPYQAIKVSVDLDNKTKINNWLDNIEDRELRMRLNHWIRSTGKTNLTTFVLPLTNLQATGVPMEIRNAVNLRKLVRNIVSPFYLVLESLGLFVLNDNTTRLVSDTYTPTKKAA